MDDMVLARAQRGVECCHTSPCQGGRILTEGRCSVWSDEVGSWLCRLDLVCVGRLWGSAVILRGWSSGFIPREPKEL